MCDCCNTEDMGYAPIPLDGDDACVSLDALSEALAAVLFHARVDWTTGDLYEAFRQAMIQTPNTDPLPPWESLHAANSNS